ncbi:hypothetical protein D3C75_1294330 [compost metagenome]
MSQIQETAQVFYCKSHITSSKLNCMSLVTHFLKLDNTELECCSLLMMKIFVMPKKLSLLALLKMKGNR